MFSIAQNFGVSLNALIAANPHIPNPNIIFPGDVLCVPKKVPPPPPKKDCPCPVTLNDFLGRLVEVTTLCGVITGILTFVGDNSITLRDPKTGKETVILCRQICFVRIRRKFKDGVNDVS